RTWPPSPEITPLDAIRGAPLWHGGSRWSISRLKWSRCHRFAASPGQCYEGNLRGRASGAAPMCRWIAYRGETVPLEQYVTAPAHSLVVQSLRALESTASTNGDGFGMGWYSEHAEP